MVRAIPLPVPAVTVSGDQGHDDHAVESAQIGSADGLGAAAQKLRF